MEPFPFRRVLLTDETRQYIAGLDHHGSGIPEIASWLEADPHRETAVAWLYIDETRDALVAFVSILCSGIMREISPEEAQKKQRAFHEDFTAIYAIQQEEDCGDSPAGSAPGRQFRSVIPAIEIHLFGVVENYRGKKINIAGLGSRTIASLVFNHFMSFLMKLTETTIGAEAIILYSVQSGSAPLLYKNSGFKKFTEYDPLLKGDDSFFRNECIPMILPI
jgi:hypothetical protein